jgi:hypothetical protein
MSLIYALVTVALRRITGHRGGGSGRIRLCDLAAPNSYYVKLPETH